MARESATLTLELRNMGPLADKLQREMPAVYQAALREGILGAALHFQSAIKVLLDGPVLNRRTGRLWRSIQPEVFTVGGTVVGIVGTDVEYAAVHEFGATIRPKKAGGVLVFRVGNEVVFAREVKIPKRPYVSRAFKEEKEKAWRIIRDQVIRRANAAFSNTSIGTARLPAGMRQGIGPSQNQFTIAARPIGGNPL